MPPDGWLVAIAMASGSARASAKMGKYKFRHLETTNNLNSNTCFRVVKVMSEHLHCFKIHIQQEEKLFLKRSTVTKRSTDFRTITEYAQSPIIIITETFREVKGKQVRAFFVSTVSRHDTTNQQWCLREKLCASVWLWQRRRKRCRREALGGQLPLLPMAATARPLFPSFPSFLLSRPTNSLSLCSLIRFLFAHSLLPSGVSTLSPAEVYAHQNLIQMA